MIERIDKIKKFGLVKDYKWNTNLPNFSQYNLIYGWNYSGKTTLSRIFRCVELEKIHSDFQNAEFKLADDQNNKVTHNQLDKSPYQLRVFNTDYVEEHLDWNSQEADPIFLLGKENIALQEQIKLKKQEITKLSNEHINNKDEKSRLDEDLELRLTDKARELDRIKPPYDRRRLRNSLKRIESEPKKYCLSTKATHELRETLKSSYKGKLKEISLKVLSQEKIKEIEGILDRTVTAQIIRKLKNNLELNNWIKKGLELLKSKEKCEFCGGILPEYLLEKYEKHFSEEYDNLTKDLNALIQDLERRKISISLDDEKRLYPKLEIQYENIKAIYEQCEKKYNEDIDKIKDLLNVKINDPFKKLSERMICIDGDDIDENCKKLNNVLKNHNNISDNFNDKQKEAFEAIVLHYACEFSQESKYFDTLKKLDKLDQENFEKRNDIEKKRREINKMESQISDIAKAADKINQYLISMFGKEHIKIKATDRNRFQLLRDGFSAKNLSSGERTAIAFSYFLTQLKDKDTDLSRTIVFIDDPISSLDSNHLFNIFSLIQVELIKCHQLFVSTHNPEFFNLIKNWLKNKIKGHKDKCRFYLNERITVNEKEFSDIKELPPTLLKYNSEYHFLFCKIRKFADNPSVDYENLYQLPNIIRRFLEAFLGFKYSAGFNELHKIIDNQSNKIKVNRFVQEFSHQKDFNRSLKLCDYNECKTIVDIVLKAVEDNDPEHYRTLDNVYQNAS